ncbi:MAG TPA: tRNA uridine-5-carboxymethylaminomethyl(34) synthesis GTPase MnmE [Thermodesulfovibrionia bacterium]|nr:tRNA uridine-5-carboxymethylaminomethyl(34) synthesis GTPase MnmE [Thermodesulfovibrionia bacterium]
MFTDETIAAISTPLGHSGIGIVKISGKDAIKIADKIFLSPKNKTLKQIPSHRIIYGHIINPVRKQDSLSNGVNSNKEIIDEALISVMRSPHTYTKEDVVEINCHGGPVPLRRILELVLKNGARLAEPGEFTRRAFLNGRIDLAQAEAVLDVINAMTEQSQKTAVEQLRGGLSKKIEAIKEKLIELTAFVEAYIDFPEEDIEPMSLTGMKEQALKIQQSLRELIESSHYGMILREGLKTAIIGRPNVGKSSLLNALLEQDRAIVTEVPGTTRDVIEDYLNIQGLPVKIMDTAGIREVEDIAEKEGVKRSLFAMKDADLALIVLDGSKDLHNTDRELIEKSNPQNTILVINKIDLPQKIKLKTIEMKHSKVRTKAYENQIPPHPTLTKGEGRDFQTVKISALKGTGLNELKDKILEAVLHGKPANGSDIVTNIRHVHALEKALKSINSFIKEIDKKTPPEFLSVELRESLDAIGEIIGITTPENILNRIFSNFCIGK